MSRNPRGNKRRRPGANRAGDGRSGNGPTQLRVVGGKLRGRPILYDGEQRTRPMKERVREAVFNLLGPAVQGKTVLDLFAGTGAMGIEALSRGATTVTAVERSFPAARIISENARRLEVESQITVERGDVFRWWRTTAFPQNGSWLVFCCPPYALYADQKPEMLQLISGLIQRSPVGSLVVLEFDARFDEADLPEPDRWDVRRYSPAIIAILEK